MAKTIGPLFSIDASGSIADTIVYAKWKGRNYARMYAIPQNPQTVNQMIQRNKFAAAVSGWQVQTVPVKAEWGVAADPYQFSGFNYFHQQYLAQNSYITNVMPTIPGA